MARVAGFDGIFENLRNCGRHEGSGPNYWTGFGSESGKVGHCSILGEELSVYNY